MRRGCFLSGGFGRLFPAGMGGLFRRDRGFGVVAGASRRRALGAIDDAVLAENGPDDEAISNDVEQDQRQFQENSMGLFQPAVHSS